jgi:hypothetical protein
MRETKLSYLLTLIGKNADQRNELCQRLGITPSTFYARRNNPGDFTLDQAVILDQFLEELNGQPVDTYQLFRELVDVPSLGTKVKEQPETV